MSSPIELKPWWALSARQQSQVLVLRIDHVQGEQAGTIERAAAAAAERSAADACGLAILAAEEVAGVLMLKRRSKAPAWAPPEVSVVSALRVDPKHRGQGIGSQALAALPSWLGAHWPECNSLAISVAEENAKGIKAYERAGFKDNGIREQSRTGWVRYMSKWLAVPG